MNTEKYGPEKIPYLDTFHVVLSTKKNKKLIGLMKDDLDGKMMKRFATLRPKICSYLRDDDHVDKKAKCTKRCVRYVITCEEVCNKTRN